MVRFVIDQEWITEDGSLRGKVIEISEGGESGSVAITDRTGARDTFHGTAEAFRRLRPWVVVSR